MIYGSGLIATGFRPKYGLNEKVIIYAAGVANSGCTDKDEFAREEARLRAACAASPGNLLFVYFGTCSVYDKEKSTSHYVEHKLAMESLVRGLRGSYLIVRLPNVVGHKANPYTLISQFAFLLKHQIPLELHTHAERNIIDINDVVAIVSKFIEDRKILNYTFNVANPKNYRVHAIANAVAKAMKVEKFDSISRDRGQSCTIHIEGILPIIAELGLNFDDGYLDRVMAKYYGATA
jgi:nucleoside-diphosphate-sugar epimerase